MTVVQTTTPEAALLAALRDAAVPAHGDPGPTLHELAMAVFGRSNTLRRGQISQALKPLIESGRVVRGWRAEERVDGKRGLVAVFRWAA